MFNAATHGQGAPRHLSTDHDPLFEAHRWQANLRLLEIDEIKTVPHVPLSHPFVERLIGTIRREFLDQVFFWNGSGLASELRAQGDFLSVAACEVRPEARKPVTHVHGRKVNTASSPVGDADYCRRSHRADWYTHSDGKPTARRRA